MVSALARALASGTLPADADDEFIAEAIAAHAGPLVFSLRGADRLSGAASARLAEVTRQAAVRTAILDAALVRACDALERAGINTLAFKGAHLAHTVYAAPHLRSRNDVDLLIAPADRDRAFDVLCASGFTPAIHSRGRLLLGQFHLLRKSGGIAAPLDIHWRLFAPLVVASALDVGMLLASPARAMVLSRPIRVPSLPQALALAVLHHTAHHPHAEHVIWLNDMRLLARAQSDDDRDAFKTLAARGRFTTIARRTLETVAACFDDSLVAALARDLPLSGPTESSATLLRPGRKPLGDLWSDLRVAGWRDGLRLLREHALPPADYMRQSRHEGWLPLAYVKRAIRGTLEWL